MLAVGRASEVCKTSWLTHQAQGWLTNQAPPKPRPDHPPWGARRDRGTGPAARLGSCPPAAWSRAGCAVWGQLGDSHGRCVLVSAGLAAALVSCPPTACRAGVMTHESQRPASQAPAAIQCAAPPTCSRRYAPAAWTRTHAACIRIWARYAPGSKSGLKVWSKKMGSTATHLLQPAVDLCKLEGGLRLLLLPLQLRLLLQRWARMGRFHTLGWCSGWQAGGQRRLGGDAPGRAQRTGGQASDTTARTAHRQATPQRTPASPHQSPANNLNPPHPQTDTPVRTSLLIAFFFSRSAMCHS